MTININNLFSDNSFEQSKFIIAAVSGGSDSLALLFLLHDFLQKKQEAWRLIAITVDHGLRPESAQEAQSVHDLCKKYNIKHEIFVWQGKKPKTGLADKARIARYNLLCQAAKVYNSCLIITGHTLDDQIETFRMRQQRRDQGRGLACMPNKALLQQEFILLRPLLAYRRQDLRAYLQSRHIHWIDDPSNENTKYERVRIRNTTNMCDITAISNQIAQAQLLRKNEAVQIAALIERANAHWRGQQLILQSIDDKVLMQPIYLRLLEILTALIGGKSFFKPATKAMEVFLHQKSTCAKKMTHSSTIIEKHAHEIRLWREQRNLTAMSIKPHTAGLWDGRFEINNLTTKGFIIRNPNLKEVQNAIKILENNNHPCKKHHIPSLLTAPLIEYDNDIVLPFITDTNKEQAANYTIVPILLPFHWLASGHDFAMLPALYKLFKQRMGLNNKILGFDAKNLKQIVTDTLASDD